MKKSILIIDDDESTCRMLSLMLGKRGYETETVGTGKEALEKAKERFFNVALLDIRLPDMEGVELLMPLKKMHPDMIIFMITGYPSLETSVRTSLEGALAYITKPLNMDTVLTAVREALEKQRLIRETGGRVGTTTGTISAKKK
jgi:DNA-binding NtrC family response regulator